jgi:hypothetical protein
LIVAEIVGLIGAIVGIGNWLAARRNLQQQRELESQRGNRVRRCKLPDCGRVIAFEPGVSARDLDLFSPKHMRGKYKIRKDRVFCKKGGCRQLYSYRKQRGWFGYD